MTLGPGLAPNLVSIEQYDAFERTAAIDLAIPEIMAYSTPAFLRVGYPVRVFAENELIRYADHNFESEVGSLYKPGAVFPAAAYENRFTQAENDLLTGLRDRVVNLTKTFFGRPIRPMTNLLVQTGPFRILSEIARLTRKERLSVFEVGPGLGYLGALLILTGHRYASYDVTQSLCLWQNRLHGYLAGSDFAEMITHDDQSLYDQRVVQIPWWKYMRFRSGSPIRADVVYSNSNLCEMTTVALQHMLHISRFMLEDSPIGLFAYISAGSPAQNDEAFVLGQLEAFGFRRAFGHKFNGFILGDRKLPESLKVLDDKILAYDPFGRGGTYDANQVMSLSRTEAPLDATICAFLNGWHPPFKD